MLFRLLLLFTLLPLVELALLVWLAVNTSLALTVGLVLLTGVAGATLARYQGFRCVGRIQQKLAAGDLPGDDLLDGLMILVAGAVLVTPGVLTDVGGLGLLLPPLRRVLKGYLKRRFRAGMHFTHVSAAPEGFEQPTHNEIIGARVIDVPAEEK